MGITTCRPWQSSMASDDTENAPRSRAHLSRRQWCLSGNVAIDLRRLKSCESGKVGGIAELGHSILLARGKIQRCWLTGGYEIGRRTAERVLVISPPKMIIAPRLVELRERSAHQNRHLVRGRVQRGSGPEASRLLRLPSIPLADDALRHCPRAGGR